MLGLAWCFNGFGVLCLVDGQCLVANRDPAVLNDAFAAKALVYALLVVGFAVVPYVLVASDSARRIRILRIAGEEAIKRNANFWNADRRCVILAAALAWPRRYAPRSLAAAAIERGAYRLGHASWKTGIERSWAACDAHASPDGRWRERESCPWSNDVRVFYPRAGKLARKRLANLRHVVLFASVEAVLLLLAALCLVLSYHSAAAGPSSFAALRRRPRLIERD